MIGKDVGDWDCLVCGEYGRHKSSCKQPSGRCSRCGRPLDDHRYVDTPRMQCPSGKVAA